MTDKTSPDLTLVPPDPAARNLAQFIQEARELAVFGTDLNWGHWSWPSIGNFLILGTPGEVKNVNGKHLHPHFVDFAKAYIRYEESQNPSRDTRRNDMTMLRMVERALLLETQDADPVDITLNTMNQAAQIACEHSKAKGTHYKLGQRLKRLSIVLSTKRLTRNDTRSWSNPNPTPDFTHLRLGEEADAHRKKHLPDMLAIEFIAACFDEEYDLLDPSMCADVYTSSTMAMLLSASQRGGEVHELSINAEHEEVDSNGVLRYGWAWRAFKNKADPTHIKYCNEIMEPFAREAFRRIATITEEPRAFARYCENQLEARRKDPSAHLRFYRHAMCPDVPDDKPLTGGEAAAALGIASSTNCRASLCRKGLSSRVGEYTLNSLWLWVLQQLPPTFPFVEGAKNRHLKYSEALFCMHIRQLRQRNRTETYDRVIYGNPLSVWLPSNSTLYHLLTGSKGGLSFFQKHNASKEDGTPLRITSHQIRHLLDTIAHEGTGDEFLEKSFVNAAAGRKMSFQGVTYDHSRPEDKAEIVREAVRQGDGSLAVFELPKKPQMENLPQTAHWMITRPGPRSCADIEMNHRSAVLATAFGGCEWDWLLEPCQFHKDCLNCKEHFCIKGAGKNDQERLDRLDALLSRVMIHQAKAKADMDLGKPGASFWYKYQSDYRERIQQLIQILRDPKYPDGSKIRLADGKANSHLHRVLREVSLRELGNKSEQKDVINALTLAYRENRPIPLIETIAVRLEQRHG